MRFPLDRSQHANAGAPKCTAVSLSDHRINQMNHGKSHQPDSGTRQAAATNGRSRLDDSRDSLHWHNSSCHRAIRVAFEKFELSSSNSSYLGSNSRCVTALALPTADRFLANIPFERLQPRFDGIWGWRPGCGAGNGSRGCIRRGSPAATATRRPGYQDLGRRVQRVHPGRFLAGPTPSLRRHGIHC